MRTGWLIAALLLSTVNLHAKTMRPPLYVTGDDKLLYVHVEGMPVGEVLSRMGTVSGWSIRVLGAEANIPVWVHADGDEPRTLVYRVALAAGLLVQEKDAGEKMLWVMSPPAMMESLRAAAPRQANVLKPTTIHPSGAPEELALLLRTHVLSPSGKAVPVPARGALIVEDDAAGSLAAKRLVGLITPNANMSPMVMEPLPRWDGPPPPPSCSAVELAPWKAMDLQGGLAHGEPIGQVLVALASLQNRITVVCCGGHVPAFASVHKGTDLEGLARDYHLLPVGPAQKLNSDATGAALMAREGLAKGAGAVFMEDDREQALESYLHGTAAQTRRALLLFPVRKPEQYTPALAEWLNLKVTALPTLGWIAVEHITDGPRGKADPVAEQVDKALRELMPKGNPPLPPLKVVELDQDTASVP